MVAAHSLLWGNVAEYVTLLLIGSSHALLDALCATSLQHFRLFQQPVRPDYPEGQAPYQRRVRFLLEAIAHPDALVTNLYFLQTRDAEQLEAILSKEFVKACWEVHELLFKITEPRVIITCHDVTEEVFCGKFVLGSKPVEIEAKHGNWKCRRLQGQWKSREICVVKIPHLSIYDITQPRCRTVLEWVKKIVRECTDGWEMQAPAGV